MSPHALRRPRRNPQGNLTLRAVKAEPVGELFTEVLWEERLLGSISDAALERMMRYILNADSSVSLLRERIRLFRSRPLQNKTMTIAEQLKQEGRQEGREVGRVEGQQHAFRTALRRMLETRFGADHPELPQIFQRLEAIQHAQRLEALLPAALQIQSLQ